MSETIWVLAISGGGVRGIIPAVFCQKIEELCGQAICRQFHLIGGTSTGGVMTMLLTRPNPDGSGRPLYRAQDVKDLYLNHAKDMFGAPPGYPTLEPGNPDKDAPEDFPMFPSASVTNTLGTYLPKIRGCELKDALTDVVVTAYDLQSREPVLFQSREAQRCEKSNYYMCDVAQATSAFPGIFPVAMTSSLGEPNVIHPMIDGGMAGANPAMIAYTAARVIYGKNANIVLVSLGTGHYIEGIDQKIQDGGFKQWAPVLPDLLFDATDHVADDEAAEVLGGNYFRLQIDLPQKWSGIADTADVGILAYAAETSLSTPPLADTVQRLKDRLEASKSSRVAGVTT